MFPVVTGPQQIPFTEIFVINFAPPIDKQFQQEFIIVMPGPFPVARFLEQQGEMRFEIIAPPGLKFFKERRCPSDAAASGGGERYSVHR